MLILISGENSFLCQKKLKEILGREQGVLNILESVSFRELGEKTKNQDLFSTKMVFVIKNCFKEKSFEDDFEREKERLSALKGKVFIFFEPETKIKKSLIDFFRQEGEVFISQNLNKLQLKKWLENEFLKYGKKVKPEVLEKMIEISGTDLWLLEEEVKKLASFKKEEKIELIDLKILFYPHLELGVFQFLDKIFSGKKKEGLILLNQLFQKEKDFQFLFSVIFLYLRNLILIKSGHRPLLHPYLLQKLRILERKFSLEDLKKIHQKMFTGEVLIKTGKMDPRIFLENLVIFGI